MRTLFRLLSFTAMAFVMACTCTPNNKPDSPDSPDNPDPVVVDVEGADFYISTANGNKLFEKGVVAFGKKATMSPKAVRLDPTNTFQSIVGFGPAITGSSGYNLLKMKESERKALLKELFDPEDGLGISLIRVSIGSSDFGLDEYTCCDKEGIENFEIHALDKRDVFPILKEIYAINPNVEIIGSPWSPPRWMKRFSVSNNDDYYSWTSGSLKPSCYQDYALYFVKWIQAMEAEGFKIHAITIQNEPLNHGNSMSMYMTWEEQRDFIKTALGPAFKEAGIKAGILLFDHNYNYDNVESQQDYPMKIMQDSEAAKYVAGTAWHNYGGRVTELDDVLERIPGKDIYFTEASIGTWNYDFGNCLLNDFESIFIETLKRGNRGVTLWNLMLDEKGAPNRPGGCTTCYGAVEVSSADYTLKERKSHYYNIAHTSKVIKPGAVRIATSGYTAPNCQYLAFRNPDGSYGVIALNKTDEEQNFVFVSDQHSVSAKLPAKSIASLYWKD